MADFDLAAIDAAADERYGNTRLTDGPNGPITLRAQLRLGDKDTAKLNEHQAKIRELAELEETPDRVKQLTGTIVEALSVAADKPQDFKSYAANLDRAQLLSLFEVWSGATQPGEAKR